MDIVPEEVPSLATRLAGNKAFGMCRGTFHLALEHVIEDVIGGAGSVTETARRLDAWYSSVRATTILLAQLRRDGRLDEANDLESALRNRNQLISGETVPLEKTVPATILMLEPGVTLKLLELFAGSDVPDEKLRELLPTCKAYEKAYDNVVSGLPRTFERSIQLGDKDYVTIVAEDGHGMESFRLSSPGSPLAFMFYGQDQASVLKKLGRDEQTRVGTWQINLPAFTVGWSPAFSLCLHKETVHAEWSDRYPALASKGVSHGYGAFFMYEGMMHLDMKRRYMNPTKIELVPLVGEEVIEGFTLAS